MKDTIHFDDYTKDKNNSYYKGKTFKEPDVKILDKHYNGLMKTIMVLK